DRGDRRHHAAGDGERHQRRAVLAAIERLGEDEQHAADGEDEVRDEVAQVREFEAHGVLPALPGAGAGMPGAGAAPPGAGAVPPGAGATLPGAGPPPGAGAAAAPAPRGGAVGVIPVGGVAVPVLPAVAFGWVSLPQSLVTPKVC